ncbi:hypothetical protein DFJ74DRAFT_693830 [Hyaloraphidium curvatum]|nr:hypothetical protein DFJ74DRAFT_693830 [Hyaloraphidium curvatum]
MMRAAWCLLVVLLLGAARGSVQAPVADAECVAGGVRFSALFALTGAGHPQRRRAAVHPRALCALVRRLPLLARVLRVRLPGHPRRPRGLRRVRREPPPAVPQLRQLQREPHRLQGLLLRHRHPRRLQCHRGHRFRGFRRLRVVLQGRLGRGHLVGFGGRVLRLLREFGGLRRRVAGSLGDQDLRADQLLSLAGRSGGSAALPRARRELGRCTFQY